MNRDLSLKLGSAAVAVAMVGGLLVWGSKAQMPPRPAPRVTANGLFVTRSAPASLPHTELASFAAGCFWGVEQEFRQERGVIATAVGYAGGHVAHPSYEEVCTGTTGHAESVRVEFDPTIVSYEHLLEVFWNLHDPTTLNRQGPDFGEQYRSAIFYFNEQQHAAAIASRDRLQRSGTLDGRIVTEIVAAGPFNAAEGYHQQYVEKGGRAACHLRNRTPASSGVH